MSIRFVRVGNNIGTIDHNDLLNKGTKTHAEIETYLAEIDKARLTYVDLDARITSGTGASTEVIAARTDKDGVVYPTLKQRLDSTQGVGGGGVPVLQSQLTKLGVTAPNTSYITIPYSSDFNRPPLEVLKFVAGATGQVSTLSAFNNADSSNFTSDSQVLFDGLMYLKTVYNTGMNSDGAVGAGKQFSAVINISLFSNIEKVEVI